MFELSAEAVALAKADKSNTKVTEPQGKSKNRKKREKKKEEKRKQTLEIRIDDDTAVTEHELNDLLGQKTFVYYHHHYHHYHHH